MRERKRRFQWIHSDHNSHEAPPSSPTNSISVAFSILRCTKRLLISPPSPERTSFVEGEKWLDDFELFNNWVTPISSNLDLGLGNWAVREEGGSIARDNEEGCDYT